MEAEGAATLEAVLRAYFAQRDSILSPDGILRICSVISCIACSALQLGGGRCGGGALAAGGAGAALGGAFVLTALGALAACGVPLRAPLTWLYVELVASTVVGGVLLLTALLMFSMCDVHTSLDYLHGPVALLGATLSVLSAVCVYRAVGRRWDRAQAAAAAPPPPAAELDV